MRIENMPVDRVCLLCIGRLVYPNLFAGCRLHCPSHARSVVGDAIPASAVEQDHPSMAI
jgi:hypothetical protein